MSTDKSKRPADTAAIGNDSMKVTHLKKYLTTSHLQAALKPSEEAKPAPIAGPSRDKGSAPTLKPEEK